MTAARTPASTKTRDGIDEDYEKLPEAIRASYTPKEYRWLGAERRARIIDEECMPDAHED